MEAIRSLVILTISQFEFLLAIFDNPNDSIRFEDEYEDAGFVGEKLGDGRVAVAFWSPDIDSLVHRAVCTAWEFQGYIEMDRNWNTAQLRDFLFYCDAEQAYAQDERYVSFCYDIMKGGFSAYKLEGEEWAVRVWVPNQESKTLAWFRMVDDR